MENENVDEKPNLKKTEEELRKLAMDVMGGSVFTDRHCKQADDINHVFLLIGLGGLEVLDYLASFENVMVYEYLEKAGPRSVNGMPSFLSYQLIVNEDVDRFVEIMKELQDFLKPPQPDASSSPESSANHETP